MFTVLARLNDILDTLDQIGNGEVSANSKVSFEVSSTHRAVL